MKITNTERYQKDNTTLCILVAIYFQYFFVFKAET